MSAMWKRNAWASHYPDFCLLHWKPPEATVNRCQTTASAFEDCSQKIVNCVSLFMDTSYKFHTVTCKTCHLHDSSGFKLQMHNNRGSVFWNTQRYQLTHSTVQLSSGLSWPPPRILLARLHSSRCSCLWRGIHSQNYTALEPAQPTAGTEHFHGGKPKWPVL